MGDNIPHELPKDYFGEFVQAIAHAFRKKKKLALMLRIRLDKKLREVAPTESNDMRIIAQDLIEDAESDGWLHELILAVVQEKPKNVLIKAFYDKYQKLIHKQPDYRLPDTTTSSGFQPLMSSNIIQLPNQGKQPHTHPPHELQQSEMQLAFDNARLPAQGDIRASIMPSSSTIPFQPQGGQRFSFHYFRGAWRYSPAMSETSRHFFT